MNKPTIDRLHALFSYDAVSGVLTRNDTRGGRKQGAVAGASNGNGYLRAYVDGRPHYVHRIAWAMSVGEWPQDLIDHINGNPMDNRIVNLRQADKRMNAENMKAARSTSRTGLLGVTAGKKENRWRAQICVHGKNRSLGEFDCPEKAHKAYLAAKQAMHSGWAA